MEWHVLRRAAEPVEGGDHEGLAVVQGLEYSVELWTRRTCTRDAVIDTAAISADASGEQIDSLSVRRLMQGRDPRIPDELAHSRARSVS